MHKLLHRLAPGVALCVPLLALAQFSDGPASVNTPAPPLRYQSAFTDYKPWREIKPGDWRAVNETVRDASQAGGHAGPMKDASGATSGGTPSSGGEPAGASNGKAPGPKDKEATPAMPGHGGHQMHGGSR